MKHNGPESRKTSARGERCGEEKEHRTTQAGFSLFYLKHTHQTKQGSVDVILSSDSGR